MLCISLFLICQIPASRVIRWNQFHFFMHVNRKDRYQKLPWCTDFSGYLADVSTYRNMYIHIAVWALRVIVADLLKTFQSLVGVVYPYFSILKSKPSFVCLFICLFGYLFIYLFTYLFICLFVYLFIYCHYYYYFLITITTKTEPDLTLWWKTTIKPLQ